MGKIDPVSGPVPREVFATLIGLPFGEATKRIRQYDPLYGRKPGEKIAWTVTCQVRRMTGVATVMAASEKEAEANAQDLQAYEVDWDDDRDDFEILTIEPEKIPFPAATTSAAPSAGSA